MLRYTYGKEGKLKKRKEILQLFESGKSFIVFPFKVFYLVSKDETGLKAGVTVGKRHFKRAVDRNRIKRLTREAYRLQKNNLELAVSTKNCSLKVFFVFVGNVLTDYATTCEKMQAALVKLEKIVANV